MSRLLTNVSEIVKEECGTSKIPGDMSVSILKVYGQSIEESKHGRRSRYAMWGITNEKLKQKFKKRALNQDGSSDCKANYERGVGSHLTKPTCATYGKKYFVKCLAGTSGCFGCRKDDHMVNNCLTISARRRESKKVPPNFPDGGAPNRNRFNDTSQKNKTGL